MRSTILFVTICLGCGCPMKVSKLQYSEKNADVTKQINALTQLITAAEGEISQVEKIIESGEASADLDLKWQLAKQVRATRSKGFSFDQETWERMNLAEQAYCALYQEVKDGFYKGQPEAHKSALEQLKTTRGYLLEAKKKLETQQ